MKSLMETYTPLIKSLQDLNQEIRLRLSSMPYYTEQEMLSLEQWLEEVRVLEGTLENHLLVISHHSRLLKIELLEQQHAATLKH